MGDPHSSSATPGTDSAVAVQVGEWLVEPGLHRLRSRNREVRIEPKAMAVLCVLAQRPAQVVARAELLDAAWPGLVVGDDALTQVVVKLRKALGDTSDQPRYIETIPKGGYRLVAPVAPGQPGTLAAAAGGKRRHWALAIPAILLPAILASWWWQTDRQPPPAPQPSGAAPLDQPPIVFVDPFQAATGDPGEAALALGIAADLVSDLGAMPGLWVVAGSPVRTEGDRATAAYRVIGTVQRDGPRIRMNVRLLESGSGRQAWAGRFEREAPGFFQMQDELRAGIVAALPLQVAAAERARAARRYTRNLDAYEVFQQGQLAFQTRRRDGNLVARRHFNRALEMDPAFARALSGVAMTYVAEFRNQWVPDAAAALEAAFRIATAALRMDPTIPETRWMLALVHSHRHEHATAIAHLDAALRDHPSFADGHALKGAILSGTGRPGDGLPHLRTAIRLAPASGYTYLMLLGRAYLFMGQPAQARTPLAQSIARNPEFLDARVYLAVAHLDLGDHSAAEWEAHEIRALDPGFTARRWLETNPTGDAALRERLAAALAGLGL